jgi:hypothetical protein
VSAADSPGERGRGRPPRCPRDLAIRIIEMRRSGLSYAGISATLNASQVPTPAGGSRWRKSTVDRVLHTRYAEQIKEDLYGDD